MDWYIKVLSNFSDFRGRARRKEYWMFQLFHWLIIFVLSMIAVLLFGLLDSTGSMLTAGIVLGIYMLVTFIPSMAVLVRRLHDSGKSGWFILLSLIPYIGGLIVFIFTLLDSEYGENKWGPNPKFEGYDTEIDEIGISELPDEKSYQ